MELDRFNFWTKLPLVLKTICEAEYVAVDLEMSGVEVDKLHSMPVLTKPDLQSTYDNARMAALQYTILQFGFTCINWDLVTKSYVIKTFNIPLYPGVIVDSPSAQHLSNIMGRCIRVSTKSLGFLERNGFNFLDVFQRGVPFLSDEEITRKEVYDFQLGNRPTEDLIDVAHLSKKSLEFRNDVEEKVSTWRQQLLTGAGAKSVRIYSPTRGRRLNGLQKRIVHQLLQDRFSDDLYSASRDGGHYLEISIHRRVQLPSHSMAQRAQAIKKQIGARILWDAICGKPFVHTIDTGLVIGEDPAKRFQLGTELKQYESRLRERSPIFVGHNILMDLCFLHANFVGTLPETVQEFRAITRERLPRIVDTKYLFTRGGDEMSPDYSLSECFAAMRGQQLPAMVSGSFHIYSQPHLHQAGYDSYMTAIVFLKKSYQLSRDRIGLGYIASEDLGEREAPRPTSISSPRSVPQKMVPALLKAREAAPATGNLLEECGEEDMAALAKFDILLPHTRAAAPLTAPPTPKMAPGPEPRSPPKPRRENKSPAREPGTIPEWEGRFWGKYGNRTRVGQFGFILYMPKMAGEKMPEEVKESSGS